MIDFFILDRRKPIYLAAEEKSDLNIAIFLWMLPPSEVAIPDACKSKFPLHLVIST